MFVQLTLIFQPTTTPWSKILSSCSVWAIIVSQACSEWGLYTFMTNIPSYMEDVLQFQIKNVIISFINFTIFNYLKYNNCNVQLGKSDLRHNNFTTLLLLMPTLSIFFLVNQHFCYSSCHLLKRKIKSIQ
jgi:hypothetical protein